VVAESPAYAWQDRIHDGVELDDAMQLQMFETYVSSNPEIRGYDCHIAPKGTYPEYANDPDNFVYVRWDFHNYFDGLKVKPKAIPPMLIRPERSYVTIDVEVNGHTYKQQRIDVLIDFTSVKGCKEICKSVKPGFIGLSPTCILTHIYSENVVHMCKF
jgi:hypothetical protein